MKKNNVILFTFGIIVLVFVFSPVFAAEYVAFSLKVAEERIG